MKLSVCVFFLGCLLVLAAAIPAEDEGDLQALLIELEDMVDQIGELQEVDMEKRNWRLCRTKCRRNGGSFTSCNKECRGWK
ncbi:Hypp9254 [Branchiostoma lanceolatum]|uniref:Hypp9253 protein n=1 Tax=Branchiostoma lanceolatum TaxID=7740 RepID=A0A8K0EGJ5_BRALA|nr:Hypp9253 [Branchiostoma lanceolatum]CAH1252335.1 Hypp9254 [Branchiostoma lanceolatum]